MGLATLPAITSMMIATPAAAGTTFDAVKARGFVICGVHTSSPGFSAPDSQGAWKGLDIDVCRGIAAAMFGDAEKTRYVPTTSQQRFTALQSGEVDVLTRNTTLTLTRDTALGFNFAGVNFYDGQAFIVKTKSGVTSARQLDGATVCVQQGTTGELNLADYFRSNNMKLQAVTLERIEDGIGAFLDGRCDAFTADGSQLAAIRVSAIPRPEDALVLPERISKEPLGPVVRHGDDQWGDLVRWVLYAMIEAEELGISRANVDEMVKSPNPAVQRVLGVVPGIRQIPRCRRALGLQHHQADRELRRQLRTPSRPGQSGKARARSQRSLDPWRIDVRATAALSAVRSAPRIQRLEQELQIGVGDPARGAR